MTANICFFGTYLSKQRGHLAPSQSIAQELLLKGYKTTLVSNKSRPFARFTESISKAIFGSMDFAIVDIYSTRVIYLNWLVCTILLYRSIPYIAVLHGGAIPERWELIKKWLHPIVTKAKAVSSPSYFIQEFLNKKGLELIYIPNPLNLVHFGFKKHNLVNPTVKLLWVRAFGEIYRPELAVELIKVLIERGVDCQLDMVGPDLGRRNEITALIRDLKLEKYINIKGSVPNLELHRYFDESDIFLNTTKYESFGLAVAEAASCGIPILSTRVGELPYLWEDGKTILFCEPNADSFADQVCYFMEHNEVYKDMSTAASQSAKRFELSAVIENWEHVFRSQKLIKA